MGALFQCFALVGLSADTAETELQLYEAVFEIRAQGDKASAFVLQCAGDALYFVCGEQEFSCAIFDISFGRVLGLIGWYVGIYEPSFTAADQNLRSGDLKMPAFGAFYFISAKLDPGFELFLEFIVERRAAIFRNG